MPSARKRLLPISAISLLVGTAGICLNFFNFLPLLRLENFSKDLLTFFGRKTPVAQDVVLLTIDEASLRLDGLLDDEITAIPEFSKMRQGWPWPRSVQAALLEKLCQAGARVVAFDLVFPGPGQGDEAFSLALRKWRDRAIIGATFTGTDSGTPSFSRPSDTLLDPARSDGMLGFANFVPDTDGIVRAAIFHATPEDFLNRRALRGEPVFDSLAASLLRKTAPQIALPVAQNVAFRFSGAPGTYRHHSLYEIFLPNLWQRNFQNGAYFKDKIVVIGPEGNWSHDEHPTPFTAILGNLGVMAGPEIHLHAFAAARAGEFVHSPAPWQTSLIIAATAWLGALVNSLTGTPLRRFAAFVAIALAWWTCAQLAFNDRGLLMPVVAPLAVFALTIFGGILFEYSRERFERLRSRATLERYVSSDVASEILDSPRSYLTSLVGVRKEVTVLFADLRNFTAMVNLLDAQELVTQLNEYYAKVIEDVFTHGGTLDKIMGDGMMVVWGNLRSDGPRQDAIQAVRAALAIQSSLRTLNSTWRAQGRPELSIGIGLAQGECVVGNIGSERKMDLTVIGEAANLAARLQALTRENQQTILFDRNVAELAGGEFPTSLISTQAIRGFENLVTVYSVGAPKSEHPKLHPEPALASA